MAKAKQAEHPSVNDLFISVPKAAKEYDVSYQWLRAAAMYGAVPAEKVGYTWVVSRDRLERFLAKHRPKGNTAKRGKKRKEGKAE